MKIGDRIYPSLLVSESFYPYLEDEGKLLDAVGRMLDMGYYKRIETGSLKSRHMRDRLGKLLKQQQVSMTQWITNDINRRQLNPATLDPAVRKMTIKAMKELVDAAAESGADAMAFVSGPDPGEAGREEGKKGLVEVICQVADKMREYPGMRLLLEPLDRGAHKNQLLGPSEDCLEVLDAAAGAGCDCWLSWDSAHMALNREDLETSIQVCGPYIGHIHLANAILDTRDPGYGDWHMPMGKPGFLDIEAGSRILEKAVQVLPGERPMGATIECRCREDEDPFENEKACRNFLQAVLDCPLGGRE